MERKEGFDESPPVALANLLQSTQRFKKDTPEMLRELKFFLKEYLLCTQLLSLAYKCLFRLLRLH